MCVCIRGRCGYLIEEAGGKCELSVQKRALALGPVPEPVRPQTEVGGDGVGAHLDRQVVEVGGGGRPQLGRRDRDVDLLRVTTHLKRGWVGTVD